MKFIIIFLFASALAASTISSVGVATQYVSGALLDQCSQAGSTAVVCQTANVGALAAAGAGSINLSGYDLVAAIYDSKASTTTTLGWTIDVPRPEMVTGVYSLFYSAGQLGAFGSLTVSQDSEQTRLQFGSPNEDKSIMVSVESSYSPGSLLIQSIGLTGEIQSPGDDYLAASIGFIGFFDAAGNALNSVDPPIPTPEPVTLVLVSTALIGGFVARNVVAGRLTEQESHRTSSL